MTNLLPEWAPNIHPLIVHFPIALLTTAVALNFLELVLPRWISLRLFSTVLYGLGVLSGWAAFFAGQSAADGVDLPSTAIPILNQHADLAQKTVILFSIVAGAKLIQYFFKQYEHLGWKISIFLLGVIGFISLTLTGDRGARLVFEQGVGVQGTNSLVIEAEKQARDTVVTFISHDDGSWTWTPSQGASRSVFKPFEFLEGTAEDLSILTRQGQTLLQINQPVTMVVKRKLTGVQMELEMAWDHFEGSIRLIHHLQDTQNYDYLTLNSREMILGRVAKGNNRILEQQSVSAAGEMVLRVVGSGKHFRGYLNGELVLHGHAGGQPAGFTGIKIEGKGTLGLTKLSVSVIQ